MSEGSGERGINRRAFGAAVVGPAALPETGYTAKTALTGLPPGQRIVYRVRRAVQGSSRPAQPTRRRLPAVV